MRVSKAEKEESLAKLREWLKPGDTLTTVLRGVSRSGMSRDIDVYKLEAAKPGEHGYTANGVTRSWLSYHVGRALGYSLAKHDHGLKVGGCGMDMGFHLVYSLASALWPDGFACLGDRCPSNEHSNGAKYRKGKMHGRGGNGYALRQEWL